MPGEQNAWGDIVDEEEGPHVEIYEDIKTVTDFIINEKTGKKEKIVSVYKINKKKELVTSGILERRNWKKFGDCKNHAPGVNLTTTNVQEDQVYLLLTSRSETLDEEIPKDLKKQQTKQIITCSICKGPHFTRQCPVRSNFPVKDLPPESVGVKPGIYIPPARRMAMEGGGRPGERDRRSNDGMTVRVSNLPEETKESDLQFLFKNFGTIKRLTLARDRETQQFKGYAHVGFSRREEASLAIKALNGYGYGHLVLQVSWPRERD
jgi:translation initiation factor 3 subunit G